MQPLLQLTADIQQDVFHVTISVDERHCNHCIKEAAQHAISDLKKIIQQYGENDHEKAD